MFRKSVFVHLLLLHCLQLKIIFMQRDVVWGGLLRPLQWGKGRLGSVLAEAEGLKETEAADYKWGRGGAPHAVG